MTDHITDKAVWSAAKAYYLSTFPGIKWEALTDAQRDAIRSEYLAWKESQPASEQELRAQLRKARIDLEIMRKKLAAANATIERLKASVPLAEELATCP